MQIKKVNSLPQTLEADTIYFVKAAQAGKMEIYITSDDASEVRTISFAGSFVSSESGEASNLLLSGGYREEEYTVTGTTPSLSPENGSVQYWTLSGVSTPTIGNWASGQSIILLVDDGAGYTINWSSLSMVWKTNGGVNPTLLTSGLTPIVLFKLGSVVYGWVAGDA